ncbi:unnamed protein product [Rotaria sp. Silwood2]|nr:unnamed protein product [Rotaria sp. Silwood2]CAF2970354.1 unnamed protein product [Rotaria sp. Silwood2]CAF3343143.1 unnamed protein product [Rotaria sp. Silwood2]CAF4085348.1 unnamed protein product [Rotaria sp. Silwood2]CAF4198649.1 unnamed protein product [Rotaria sp. Silwood2]
MNSTSSSISRDLLAAPYQLNIWIGSFFCVMGNLGCFGNLIVFSSFEFRKRAYTIYFLMEAASNIIYFDFLLLTRVLQRGFQISITTRYNFLCKIRQFDSVLNADVTLTFFSLATIDRILSLQRSNGNVTNGKCIPLPGFYTYFDSYTEVIFTAMFIPLVVIVLAVLLLRSIRGITQRQVAPTNTLSRTETVKGSDLQRMDSRLTFMILLQLIIAITTRVPYAVQVIYTNITQSWPNFYVSLITNRGFRRRFINFFRKLLTALYRREIN